MTTACRIPNPHAGKRTKPTEPLWTHAASDGAVRHRLLSGRTTIEITDTAARTWEWEQSGVPRRVPGPLPTEVVCGRWLIGLVGSVGDVRVLERQDPDWLVSCHQPRAFSEPTARHAPPVTNRVLW
tara:strand:+ start:1161 stop:1538 length:378 start_codon:yes stop_codon:yes gene_type:complete